MTMINLEMILINLEMILGTLINLDMILINHDMIKDVIQEIVIVNTTQNQNIIRTLGKCQY